MAKVGIPPAGREAVFACVAAVLHLGNVAFTEGRDHDSSMVAPGGATEALTAAGERGRRESMGQLFFDLSCCSFTCRAKR
jgi:hypothetical protein